MIPPPPRSTLFPYTTLFRSELDLVEHDDGRNPVRLGDDQKSVEHSQIGLGIARRRDDHDLVHVRGERLGAGAALAGGAPRQDRAPRTNPGNRRRPIRSELELHDVPADDAIVVPPPQPAPQHGRHFTLVGVHAVARPGTHQHDARAQGHRTSPPAAPAVSMQRSRCRFTSCSVRASTGASASAGVVPQPRYSVSRCPTGRSPPSDQRTNSSAAPYRPFAFGASSTNVATEYARPSVPPNAGARSCARW